MFSQESLQKIRESWDRFVQTLRERANEPHDLRLGAVGLGLFLLAILLGSRKNRG